MTFRIDIVSPATITVLSGESSLETVPPGGISVSDSLTGTISVTLAAGNSGAAFSASSAGGATISSSANSIVITGLQAQVNAALASLTISEPAGPGTDTISVIAIDAAELVTRTAIAVGVGAATGPAFAAPPATIALSAYSLTTISGLVLGDPEATALAEAGLGASETLVITLAVASGILLLPGLSSLGGIQATGNGTNEILLTFTADRLAAVNGLLASLEYAAPAATSGLAYAMRNVAGPLGGASTSGNITLDITGAPGSTATITSGAGTAILGASTLTGRLAVANAIGDIGGISGSGAIAIIPDASLQLPYNALSLGGTSYDFGTLGAAALNEDGTLFVAGGAVIGGLLALSTAGFIDFAGTLTAGAQAQSTAQVVVTLAAGALVTGGGTLVAGNFSNSAVISGPGTILAGPGETLLVDAGAVSGTTLDVAAGGVMVLGPIAPLYGVFDTTGLTILPNVTLDFLDNSGAVPVTGGFADSLAQPGGVIVLNGPNDFAGTIIGFTPGDRMIFPGITGLTVETHTSEGFVLYGVEGTTSLAYTLAAAIPAGTTLFVGTDDEGDGEISLGATVNSPAEVFIGGVTAASDAIFAEAGFAQPILGIDVLLRNWTTQSLTVTLSVGHGILSDGNYPLSSMLTLNAASPAALDATLAGVLYTASSGFAADNLTISSATGLLGGLSEITAISISTVGGTVLGFGNAGQTAWFAGGEPPLITAAAPGAMLVTGTADFADRLLVRGLSGTSLLVDEGGAAIFDAAADAAFGNEIIIGDSTAGSLEVLTDDFFAGRDVTIGGGTAASGAIITGIATIAGTLMAGESGVAAVDLAGGLGAAIVFIGAAGNFAATGTANAGFDTLFNAGTLQFLDQSTLNLTEIIDTGTINIGGTARISAQFTTLQNGLLDIGPDAAMASTQFTQSGGTLALSGTLFTDLALPDSGVINLAGGTIIAPALSLSGAALGGFGYIEGTAGLGTILLSGGTLLADGALVLGDDVSLSAGAGIGIGGGAALDIVHGVSGGTISFAGGSAELTLNDLAEVTAAVAGMVDHDAIDLIGIAPSLVSFAAGSISAGTLGGFSLAVANGQPALQIGADGLGGTLLTLDGDMPCFCAGTRLLTPNGYRPVESFCPGDPLVTLDGAVRAVRWIGRRTLDLADEPRARPVFFAAGAFGEKIPVRPVLLSPLHAVFIGGVLVPALHLVNGATITQTERAAATYYHLELDRHDILLAEGMGAESYLDTGNRGGLYHEQGRRGTCRTPCASLVTAGPKLAAIRRRLHNIALAAGFALTYDAALRGAAGQRSVVPRIARKSGRRIARFRLPVAAASLALAARAAAPADTDPDSEDRRRVAICLDDAGGASFGAGWLPRAEGDFGLWMGSSGEILIPRERFDITLGIAAVVRSWRPPAFGPK